MESLHPLDNPVFESLTGAHARFAVHRGRVLFYPADVSPFFVMPNPPAEADWAEVAAAFGRAGSFRWPAWRSRRRTAGRS